MIKVARSVLPRGVYHFSPACNLTRQRSSGIADGDGKKGPPLPAPFALPRFFYATQRDTRRELIFTRCDGVETDVNWFSRRDSDLQGNTL